MGKLYCEGLFPQTESKKSPSSSDLNFCGPAGTKKLRAGGPNPRISLFRIGPSEYKCRQIGSSYDEIAIDVLDSHW